MGRGRGGLWLTRPFRRPAVKLFQRLSAKFMVGVGGILAIALALSIFVNTQVVERYYLRRQTGYVEAAGQRLEALIGRGMEPEEGAQALEEAEKVLVAIGRKANTASLNLEAAGLANDRGRIIVNDKMETSVPGVYAIGDCVKGYAQLAHTASAMGEVAAENIMGTPAVYDEKTNPTCVYMEPEAASVGLTEEQCKAKGIDYKVGKFPLVANGKSLIINGLSLIHI